MVRSSAVVWVLAMASGLWCSGCAATARGDSSASRPRPRASATASATPSPDPSAAVAAAFSERVKAALTPVRRQDGYQVAVAVDDLTAGQQAASGGRAEFVTASIVKVDILATLLYQAQQSGQALSSGEQALATTMIENSNNDAASDLYYDAGAAPGIDAVNKVLGLTQTTVGTDGYWGLTTTTADDQIRLLRAVFTSSSPLSAVSRDYIKSLMSNVESDQQWGVPAAASPGTSFMVKNGWLPNPTLWEINSIGEITRHGQLLLIAVLSDDNSTESDGIAVVESAAEAAARSAVGLGD
jgi:Beta-lactamase enzyme family